MEGFPTLAGSGADQDHMTARCLLLHLGRTVLNQAKDAVEIDGERCAPLFVGHLVDGSVVRRPDTVIADHDVDFAKVVNCSCDQWAGGLDGGKVSLHSLAAIDSPTLLNQALSLCSCFLIVEKDLGAGA